MAKISRRGFLCKLAKITGVGTGALIASKLPDLPEEAPELEPVSVQEQALQSLLVAQGGYASACFVVIPNTPHHFPTEVSSGHYPALNIQEDDDMRKSIAMAAAGIALGD